jgi:hypothetical protein
VIHGGEVSDSTLHEETWQLALAAPRWTQVASSGSLPYGGGYSAVYDPRRHRLVVFGYTNDTWALWLEGDALVRRPLATLGTPPLPRRSQSMDLRSGSRSIGGVRRSPEQYRRRPLRHA